jgi:tetratricopeptide (TPR) repeat protein
MGYATTKSPLGSKDISEKHLKMKSPDLDPSMGLFIEIFDKQANRAYQSYKNGQKNYAQSIVKNISGQCIACHSRHSSGPEFAKLPANKKLDALSPFEKAQFYAATRQFDAALPIYNTILSDDKMNTKRQIEWQKSAQQALAIAVRYKNNPDLAMEVTQKIINSKAPDFLKKHATIWKTSIEKWKAESKDSLQTDKDYLELGKKLFKTGTENQKYSLDHSSDIYFLRVTALMHELMSKFPQSPLLSEALLLNGRSYEIINDQNIWPIHEMFYELCIKKSPHTPTAKECYNHFEESVYFGYSGSGGFAIPADVQQTLEELKKVSQPKS